MEYRQKVIQGIKNCVFNVDSTYYVLTISRAFLTDRDADNLGRGGKIKWRARKEMDVKGSMSPGRATLCHINPRKFLKPERHLNFCHHNMVS